MEFECLESPAAVTIQHEGVNYKFWGENSWLIMRQLRSLKTFYELEMLEFLRAQIPNPGVIVDVGACIGNHSVFFDRVMNAQVISIEPNDPAFDAFGANCANGQAPHVTALRCGAGAQVETRKLDYSACAHELGYNIGGVKLSLTNGTAGVQDAQVIPIDGILENATGNVDLIKIDCEGMEQEVLQGAERTLATHCPWLAIEIADAANLEQFDAYLKESHTRIDKQFNHTPTWVYKPLDLNA